MSEAVQQSAPEAAAPSAVIEQLPPKRPSRDPLNTDKLADDALAKGASNQRAQTRETARARAERDVEDALGPDFGYPRENQDEPEEEEEDDDAPAPAAKRKPAAEEPEAEVEAKPQPNDLDSDEGTKKRPYTRDDLPEDKFIKVKVNGEFETVAVRDLADHYSGKKAVEQGMSKLAAERSTMQREVQEARKAAEQMREEIRDLFKPEHADELYDLLSRDNQFEGILQHISKKRWLDLQKWSQDPRARAQFEHERNQRALAAQQEAIQQAQQREQQAQHQRVADEHREKVLKPGFNEGIKRSGYPEPTPELYKLAQVTLDQLVQQPDGSKRLATSEDVAKAVHYAARYLKLPAGAAAPPPKRSIIQPKQKGQKGKKDYDSMPRYAKTREDDFFMPNKRYRG